MLQTSWDKTGENLFQLPDTYQNRCCFTSGQSESWTTYRNRMLNPDINVKSFETCTVTAYLQKQFPLEKDWTNELWSVFWNSTKYMYYNLLQTPSFCTKLKLDKNFVVVQSCR